MTFYRSQSESLKSGRKKDRRLKAPVFASGGEPPELRVVDTKTI